VTISSPIDQSVVQGRVTVSVTVSSSTKVGQVLLYVDAAQVSQDTRAPYSFAWSTTSVAAGIHTLTCVAYDRQGVEIASKSCLVTVSGFTARTWWWLRLATWF
jgi:uncharacterized membrane protein